MPIVDASDLRDSAAAQLLHRLVCALVDHTADVSVLTQVQDDGATLVIHAHPQDVGKVIGNQGRTAKSLRTIMSGIGRKTGRRFTIVIGEGEGGATHARPASPENFPL
jgi:predicted RNA-binding protein YlqC (UPF0109 family)